MRWLILWAWCCGACVAQTSGERVRVSWEMAEVSADERNDFQTKTGYTVHLDEARLELKAVYLYAPASATQKAIAWLERGLVSVAYAHGGVDVEKGRRVLAEWTKAMSIDVLADSPVRLAQTDAEGGQVDAVKLTLPDSGVVAHVRGHAERDGQRWSFEADIEPKAGAQRLVELLSLDEALAEDSVVQLTVHPKTWFNLCEFAELGADSDYQAIGKEDQVGRAIDIGVRSPDAFSLSISTAGGE